MTSYTVRVRGLRELVRACDKSTRDVKRGMRDALRQSGDVVRVESTERFSVVDARSAAGYRTVVRQRGVSVEQSLRRTTGKHPDFGAKQMREALMPALDAKQAEVVKAFEENVIDRAAENF